MEDNAPAHDAGFTNWEREKQGVPKVDWPPNSPDFNPIKRIWWLMKHQISRLQGCE
ncbi:transposable element Tcb1 transposase [Choiromyces venosus 120613-1]|uniref:Transposable element Tcb1 transposase n=1 Tax=Choiromyces venosus 120613-1 TaxID=1336337 RepID=A0A3N4K8H9_9PEZI|nr:transposable element Tcb1 transposase [Choiromyces venosus 120613-1]